MLRRPLVAALTVAATVAALLGASVPADAATASIGYLDQSYSGAANPPTSDKPQSKLWYVGGYWFADMWSSSSAAWHIFRLDRPSETWVDTKVAADNRSTALADTLWDGTHLYIASHVVSVSTEAKPIASQSGKPAKLYRYSYNASTRSFTLNSGFPTTIENYSGESMTIDKDSTGRIWATWTQVSGNSTSGFTSKVYVNATSTAGTTWGTPFVIPAAGNSPSPDDISSVVAFGKNKIGVLWSNQLDQTVYWAVHNDGTSLSTWHGGTAIKGNKTADDHLNLKSIQADPSGRVFAAVKTSADEVAGSQPTDPQILLLVYKPGTGSWSSTVFGTLADCHTRPQVVLDETNSIVHVVATGPSSATGCPAPGTAGTIYDKSAPMDNPVFPAGRGTPIIRDGASANMNNATTSKQSVTAASGMIVLASNSGTKRYWHADIALGGSTGGDTTAPSTPTNLTATASSSTSVNLSWTASTDNVGVTGYDVYRDGSTTPLATVSSGTSYTDSTVAASTSYTYTVSAIDAAGNESPKASVLVTTSSGGSTGTTTLTFTPTNDATVNKAAPTTNYGTANRVVVDGSPLNSFFLQFDVAGTTGCTVTDAKLRLTVGSTTYDNSAYGGDLYEVASNSWSESTLNWNNQPTSGTTKVGSIASAVKLTASYTIDVTPLISGDGPVSMKLASANGDAAKYFSKEGSTAQAPQLQVSCSTSGGGGGGGGGAADTTAPTMPTGLTATASSSTAVNLSWTPSTDDVGVTGYRVYRNGGTTPLATVPSGTAYTDSTVSGGTPYTYQVSAIDAAGNESGKASVSVTTPSGGSTGGTSTFSATNDATVNKGAPTTNYGTANRIIAGGSPLNSFYVQFDVSGTSGCTVTDAKLRLTVGSSSADNAPYGGDVYGVPSNSWSESTVTWNTQPTASSTKVASITTTVKRNATYTFDVTPLVSGDGLVSMKVASTNSDAAKYWSKEGSTPAQAPQLQVTCG